MNREELIGYVKEFYKEKEIDPIKKIDGNIVAARIILFVEWLIEKKKNSDETWEDIFNAQPK